MYGASRLLKLDLTDPEYRKAKNYPSSNKSQKLRTGAALSDAATDSGSPTEVRHRILIVDDETDITNLFKFALEHKAGIDVDVYNDPATALSNYRPGVYDLLLLDIRMPKMSGLELYKKIKEKGNGKIRVCFITAFEEYYKEFERLLPDLEVDCFIRKPISIDKLVEVVKSQLVNAMS